MRSWGNRQVENRWQLGLSAPWARIATGVAAAVVIVLVARYSLSPIGRLGVSPSSNLPMDSDALSTGFEQRKPVDINGEPSFRDSTNLTHDATDPANPTAIEPDRLACLEEFVQSEAPIDQVITQISLTCNLQSLNAEEMAEWACRTRAGFRDVSLIFGERLAVEPWESVLDFVANFQSACNRYQESMLTISALRVGRVKSEAWYLGVLSMIDSATLLPKDGSEAIIQIAEEYIRSLEDPRLIRLVMEVGRGEHGGTDEQLHRAALISIVCNTDPYSRLAYMQSILGAQSSSGVATGALFAHFLCGSEVWLDGDPRPAVSLLLAVLNDDRFAVGCALRMKDHFDSPHPPGAEDLWESALEQADSILQSLH